MTLVVDTLAIDYPSARIGPITATFEPGVTVVLGPSGSGKSTLLSLIAGFETPTTGTVTLDGRRIDTCPPEDRNVGVVFQDDALFPHLSVRENVAFGAAEDRDIEATCERFEIGHLLDRDPTTLSGGEAQRVALARTLASDPDVLLLDEPLSSLDAPIRRRLGIELRKILADLDVPVISVTHDRDEAAILGDRLAVVFDGEIVTTGSVEDVFENPGSVRVAQFLGMETLGIGTVVSTDGATTVAIGGQTLRSTDAPPGRDVTVAVRPGDVTRRNGSGGENTFRCRVDRVVPQQTDRVVVLSCDGLETITARLDDSGALDRGDELTVAVPAESVRLLAGGSETER